MTVLDVREHEEQQLTSPDEEPLILAAIETHSIDVIPDKERHGTIRQQGVFWFLSNTQTLSVAVGFIGIALGLSVRWTIAAVVLGNAFGTVFMALHASQGPRLGLPQMIQSRAQFGYRGVVLPLFLALFTYLIFAVLDTVIITQGFNQIFGWNTVVVGVVIAVVAVLLAVYGYDWLHRAFRVLFWVSLPLWLVLTIGILTGSAGGRPAPHSAFGWIAFFVVFAASASNNISYAPVVSDYSRYLPRSTPFGRVVTSVYVGAFLSLSWLAAIGAWLAAHLGATDALTSVQQAGNHITSGFGTALITVATIALVATMGEMAYSGQLVVLTAIDSIRPIRPTVTKRVVTASVFATTWAVLGLAVFHNVTTAVDDGLTLSLYLLTPWTIVNLYDYFFVRKGKYAITELENRKGLYGVWGWRGIAAYVAGFAAAVPFWDLSFYVSPVAKATNGLDITFIVELLVSGVLYVIFARSIDLSGDAQAIEASNAKLIQLGILEPRDRTEPVQRRSVIAYSSSGELVR
ncbi:MAG: cytosine permease [Acidimicrobiales bacterium]|jgi:purine-cytosine permease-like protein